VVRTIGGEREREPEMMSPKPPHSSARAAIATHRFWLVFEYPGSPLTFSLTGVGKTLPVFSFAEEADLFMRLTAGVNGSRIEEMSGEELISLISDPSGKSVERIALDPPGKNEAMVRLLSVSRQDFLRSLHEQADAAAPSNIRVSERRQLGSGTIKAETGGNPTQR
jgi:hypothetical protein